MCVASVPCQRKAGDQISAQLLLPAVPLLLLDLHTQLLLALCRHHWVSPLCGCSHRGTAGEPGASPGLALLGGAEIGPTRSSYRFNAQRGVGICCYIKAGKRVRDPHTLGLSWRGAACPRCPRHWEGLGELSVAGTWAGVRCKWARGWCKAGGMLETPTVASALPRLLPFCVPGE